MQNKPLIMAHAGRMSLKFRENSVLGVRDSLKNKKIGIIELDVRRSRDGVLFCYHGFPWWRFLMAWGLRFFSMNTIRKIVKVDTLSEIVSGVRISSGIVLFLDIKDRSVTAREILKVCGGLKCEIWVAAMSVRYLRSVRNKRFKLVYNFGFLRLKRGVLSANRLGVSIIKVFPWQLSRVGLLKKKGIGFACFGKGAGKGEWRVG